MTNIEDQERRTMNIHSKLGVAGLSPVFRSLNKALTKVGALLF